MTMLKQSDLTAADLPIEAFRAHLRMGTGFGEDTLQDPVLESFLRAALASVEAQTAKALIARTMTYHLPAWSRSDAQALPVAPVREVQTVRFVSPDGTDETVEPSLWRLREDDACPVVLATKAALPLPPRNAEIEIAFLAGFGAWEAVPADLQQAVLLLASHYYENRSATRLRAGCMPFGVTALIEPYRLRRVGFGGIA